MDTGVLITVFGTLAGAVLTAAAGFWAVVWSTGKQRKLNQENRLQDKKQELIVALDVWEELLANFQAHIKLKTIDKERYTDLCLSPFLSKLNLCLYLMDEYSFVSPYVRDNYLKLSKIIVFIYASPNKILVKYLEEVVTERKKLSVENDKLIEIIQKIQNIEKPTKTEEWLKYKKDVFMILSELWDETLTELNKEIRGD